MSSVNTETPPPSYSEKSGLDAPPTTDAKLTPPSSDETTPLQAEAQLNVDFTWRNQTAQVSEPGASESTIFTVEYRTFKSPHLLFKDATSDQVIGGGTLHPISINADYELHGEKGKLKALRRFHTEYTHLSRAYSPNDTPVAMQWSSGCGFKTWDFICKGPDGVPVAKFTSNSWAVKKVGTIDFYGPLATSREAQEEILVTGLTLFSCMVLRTTSILSFFGGVFARPGPLPNPGAETETAQQGHEVK